VIRAAAVAIAAALCLAMRPDAAAQTVRDDAGNTVLLARPATRIAALSPGITELLFEIGAGERLVAASEFSDYPPEARALPRVARAQAIDLERLASLRPDLVVIWGSGYPQALQEAVRRLGIPIYVHEPRSLEDIATAMERLGRLADAPRAGALAAAFRSRRGALAADFAARSPVAVFYQVWAHPLMTVSGYHVISEVMRLCGARNVFEGLAPLVASVDIEAVIAARPELLVAAESGAVDRGALEVWNGYPRIPAVQAHHLATLDADALERSTGRILDAAQALCARVEEVRADR
jgi:iron complex transport system substrate-binding protein